MHTCRAAQCVLASSSKQVKPARRWIASAVRRSGPQSTARVRAQSYDLEEPSSSSHENFRPPAPPAQSRPTPSFPCVDAHTRRASVLAEMPSESGPEPSYSRPTGYKTFTYSDPFPLTYSTIPLAGFDIAYETWGALNPSRDNAILLHTGLSASSHAASTPENPADGWWEKFIGPGKPIDTNRYFVICTNVLGGCYGSTGPSSPDPASPSGEPYATRFPILSMFDMVRAQFHLLDHLSIDKLYASVGSSMGGMQSLAAGWLEPDRVGKIVSISGTARSSPGSIAMRYAQRSVLMADPNWNKGFYYGHHPPHTGMKLARQIATITYRSGPEWELRFGRQVRELPKSQAAVAAGERGTLDGRNERGERVPALCPDFLIETYLDHQGESFCLKYDANSLIYISKAMDLFDMTSDSLASLPFTSRPRHPPAPSPALLPSHTRQRLSLSHPSSYLSELAEGLAPLRDIPTLVLGIQSDILFPVEQQREVADALRMAGNSGVVFYELGGVWGHDTFLIDVANVGGAIRGFLA